MKQIDIIKKSKYIYILQVESERYSVFVLGKKGLEILWPEDGHELNKATDLLPMQVYFPLHLEKKNDHIPAFHFHIKGNGNWEQLAKLAWELRKINPKFQIMRLSQFGIDKL